MGQLDRYIEDRRHTKAALLMCHIMAGYPSLEANREMLSLMSDCGVDLIELQMPFTEPIADGETFAVASQIAVAEGLTIAQYFDLMTKATESSEIPVIAMGYYNWPYRMGLGRFVEALSATGASGWILPDLPIEEAAELRRLADKKDVASVFMMTPTDSDDRLAEIGTATRGFSYCALRRGVTGQKTYIGPDTVAFLDRCRRASTLPLAAGFGVASGADAESLKAHSDIVIVGSALLRRWQRYGANGFRELLRELVSGCS